MADPFDIFGSDSEGENSGEVTENLTIAKSLMEQANTTLISTPQRTSSRTTDDDDTIDYIDLSYLKALELPWPSPLYKGAIGLFDELPFGGGRGFVALERLAPGTTILIQNPVMEWSDEQLGKKLDFSAVRYLLLHPNAHNICSWIEDFHPSKSNVDDTSEDDESQQQISTMIKDLSGSEVSDLVELAKTREITCQNSSPLVALDIFRILLAIRYNGLESGIYLHAAMLNHSCYPNCAKLLPQDNQSYSEVVTTREVSAGESLTISYVPNVMCHASRRQYLYNHHRFDILATLKPSFKKMELVNGNFPKSSVDHVDSESPTQRIEICLNEFEKIHDELAAVIRGREVVAPDVWESVKAFEQSALELYEETTRQLSNDQHLLLIPCLLIHLEACDSVQRAPGLSVNVQLGILSRQVKSYCKLIPLQISLLGPHHFDLGRSHLDYANAIGELLSRSPKHLFNLNLSSLASFENWSRVESDSRREHKRIKNLYSEKAETLLAKTELIRN